MISKATAKEQITADEIEDVLYLARANEAEELTSFLSELAQKYNVEQGEIIAACVDQETGNTAIHYSAANGHTALLENILPHLKTQGTSNLINQSNSSGNTPLHWASINGHLQTVEVLVKAGSDLWLRNQVGNLAVFEAERAGKDDVVALLLKVGGTEREKDEAGKVETPEETEEEFTMRAGDMDEAGTKEPDSVTGAQEQLQKASLDG